MTPTTPGEARLEGSHSPVPHTTTMSTRRLAPMLALLTLILAQMACRPVMTIGWGEIAIFGLLALIVVVPLIVRFFRWLDKTRDRRSRR